jgi:integrase
LIEALLQHRAQSAFNKDEDYILANAVGGPLEPGNFRKRVLYPVMDELKIKREDRKYGLHILRHTAGSIVHTATGNLKLIQEFLGHSRISTTSDIYVHVPETMTGQATEIMVKEINLALSLPTEPELVH